MKKRWVILFLKRSISQRKGRVIIASISVTLAVAVITGMIGITFGINKKLGSELKTYGANIIVSPREGNYFDSDIVNGISRLANVTNIVGQIYDSVHVGEQAIEIVGVEINNLKNRGWRLFGGWPAHKHEILAGINLKEALNLDIGKNVLLSHPLKKGGEGGFLNDNKKMKFVVSGVLETGQSEDRAFIMSIANAQELTGLDGKLSAVLVRGKTGELDSIRNNIMKALPTVEVKTIKQVALAEASLLNKIQLLMIMVTVVVLFAAAISVASTMGANVLERREEIGLMMAIGATRNEISLFYAAEAVLIGLLGGFTGFVSGCFSAQAISKGAFGSFITMPYYTVVLSLVSGLLISLLASHFPVRNAMKQSPAVILKGD
jgi:putative ABC transport system permease protein